MAPFFLGWFRGTWRILETNPTLQEINRRIQECFAVGISTIDTAEIYGLYHVEEQTGSRERKTRRRG